MSAVQLPRRLLLGPGPSEVPPSVLASLAQPTIGHLDPAFLALMDEVRDMLRRVFGTSNELTLPLSGTGSAGMEAAFDNFLEPGDTAIVGVNGVFGQRMVDCARRAGAAVEVVEAPWGEPIEPAGLLKALERTPDARLLAVVHAETSTGVEQPLDELGEALRSRETLFVVDAVTSLGGIPVDVDRRGIDVCYSGTQKCLSAPPGLAPFTVSPKAARRLGKRGTPVQSWYLDLSLLAGYWGEGERVYHHTAPINALYGLHEALRLLLEEGLEARYGRHRGVGRRLQEELVARSFQLFAGDGYRLPQLTSAQPPPRIGAAELQHKLLSRYGIEVGGGLGPAAGKIIRIGLMGFGCSDVSVSRLLDAIDTELGGRPPGDGGNATSRPGVTAETSA